MQALQTLMRAGATIKLIADGPIEFLEIKYPTSVQLPKPICDQLRIEITRNQEAAVDAFKLLHPTAWTPPLPSNISEVARLRLKYLGLLDIDNGANAPEIWARLEVLRGETRTFDGGKWLDLAGVGEINAP